MVVNCSLSIHPLVCGIAWRMSIFLVSFAVRLKTRGKLWLANGEQEVIDVLLMQRGPSSYSTSLDAATMGVTCSRYVKVWVKVCD